MGTITIFAELVYSEITCQLKSQDNTYQMKCIAREIHQERQAGGNTRLHSDYWKSYCHIFVPR